MNGFLKKIMNWEAALSWRQQMRQHGKKVVFTNGCFDLLHQGHVRYLAEARSLGECLIVGLNADESVRRLKGPHRPINDQESRAVVLAALASVDAVVIFDEDTPHRLIGKLLPDILTKGGDWTPDQIIGSDIVLKAGGQVFSLTYYDGYSTSRMEQHIKNILE